MENEIKLLKNNDKKEWNDLEWLNEFYDFLKGTIPEGMQIGRGHNPNLSPNKAYTVIWYLQEHFPLLPDTIEQCSSCKELYDSNSSGYHSELTEKFYCDNCFPPFLYAKEQRIFERRFKKKNKKS